MIYNLVDGKTSVDEIANKSDLGDFEALRIILELLNRNLIRKMQPGEVWEVRETSIKAEAPDFWKWAVPFLAALLIGASIFLFPLVFPGSYLVRSYNAYRNDVSVYLSKSKLEKIDKMLTVYYFSNGRFPARLEELLTAGYLKEANLVDPWGRNYGYALFDDAYMLAGLNGEGKKDERLEIINNFSSLQKKIIQSSIAEGKSKTFGFASDLP
jgi:hypothetical protein